MIPSLLRSLSRHPASATVANPYTSPHLRDNLEAYLSALCAFPYSGHLFVGEAPGHRGCARTGIPFTSERVLRSGSHPLLVALLPKLTVDGEMTENTATIVWERVSTRRNVPAFWNVFPFHPHACNDTSANRRPNAAEIAAGRVFSNLVIQILDPHTIVAVGEVAAAITPAAFPKLKHAKLRHPSFGGADEFRRGFDGLYYSQMNSQKMGATSPKAS